MGTATLDFKNEKTSEKQNEKLTGDSIKEVVVLVQHLATDLLLVLVGSEKGFQSKRSEIR